MGKSLVLTYLSQLEGRPALDIRLTYVTKVTIPQMVFHPQPLGRARPALRVIRLGRLLCIRDRDRATAQLEHLALNYILKMLGAEKETKAKKKNGSIKGFKGERKPWTEVCVRTTKRTDERDAMSEGHRWEKRQDNFS